MSCLPLRAGWSRLVASTRARAMFGVVSRTSVRLPSREKDSKEKDKAGACLVPYTGGGEQS